MSACGWHCVSIRPRALDPTFMFLRCSAARAGAGRGEGGIGGCHLVLVTCSHMAHFDVVLSSSGCSDPVTDWRYCKRPAVCRCICACVCGLLQGRWPHRPGRCLPRAQAQEGATRRLHRQGQAPHGRRQDQARQRAGNCAAKLRACTHMHDERIIGSSHARPVFLSVPLPVSLRFPTAWTWPAAWARR